MTNKMMLEFMLMALQIFYFSPSATSYTTKAPNGLSLKMIHRDSPASPLYNSNLTDEERMVKYIELSNARVRSLTRSHASKNDPNRVVIRPTLSAQSALYLVQLGIGTFEDESSSSRTYYLGLDTGSDLIWTQCEGCANNNCFHQVDPYFPATRSSTYWPFPSSQCPEYSQHHGNECRLQTRYADSSKVLSIVAKEFFTFASGGGRSQSLRLIFGCGIDMQNFHEGERQDNKLSGMMGMGYGFYGFMRQTIGFFDGKFSYCLQPMLKQEEGSPMYLRFGDDVLPRSPAGIMQATPMFQHRRRSSFYLNLQGISVAGQRLTILPSSFAIKSDNSGGCIIDTGATISRIVRGAFNVVKAAVKGFIKKNNKNLREMKPPKNGYNLCYIRYKDPVTKNLPTITFHFENNANFEMDVGESFYNTRSLNGDDVVCMEFVEDDLTFLGVAQQANKRIIYDLKNSLLQFAPADCSVEN